MLKLWLYSSYQVQERPSYLFACDSDACIWVSDFVALIQNDVMPVVFLNVILHNAHI